MMPSLQTDTIVMGHSLPTSEGGGRVIRFPSRGVDPDPSSPVKDFAPYEGLAEPGDNRRTLVNVLAAAVIIVLMIIGGWVTGTMAQIQSDQVCAVSDPGHCPPIYVPYIPARQRNKPYPFL
jgi:hypothetical protein